MPEPRETEAVAVTLVRIDLKVDGIAKDISNVLEKVNEVRLEVIDHRCQIGKLQSDMQQVQSDAEAAAKAVIDAEVTRKNTAHTVQEEMEKRVAAAKALAEQSKAVWSPFQKMLLVITAATAVAVALAAWLH